MTKGREWQRCPVLPGVFMIAAATLTVFSVGNNPRNSLAGLAVILLGVPLHYELMERRARVYVDS